MVLVERGRCILATLLVVFIIQIAGQTDDSKRRTGNTCSVDTECPDNAWCSRPGTTTRGYCVCKDSYIIHAINDTNRACLREAASVGDACTVDLQCQSKLLLPARCMNGVCHCKIGAHIDSGRCYDTAVVGERCTVSQNCYIGDDGRAETQAFCVKGFCSCTLLHSPRDGGTRCVRDAALGDQCEDDEQCVVGGLRCSDGICRCLDNHVPHPLEPRCLSVTPELGGVCEVETQCRTLGTGATCDMGECSCAWGTREGSGRCWTLRVPGEECTDSRECISDDGGNGTCFHGACSTRSTFQSPQTGGSDLSLPGLITTLIATATSLLLLF